MKIIALSLFGLFAILTLIVTCSVNISLEQAKNSFTFAVICGVTGTSILVLMKNKKTAF